MSLRFKTYALVKAHSLPGTLMGVTQPAMRKETGDGQQICISLFLIKCRLIFNLTF